MNFFKADVRQVKPCRKHIDGTEVQKIIYNFKKAAKTKELYLSCYLEIASSSFGNEGIEISSCKDIQMKHKNLNEDADFFE